MRRIFGFVLAKEANTGIPNLVVTAFDREPNADEFRKQSPSAALLRTLGRRLSSVLTDENGKFELSPDDLAFSGNETRPDLTIAVFAPEDILDPAHPYPDPPENRLLYLSVVPRTDAGAEEVFVIRLLQEQLDKFRIDTSAHRLANAVESGWLFRDTLKSRLAARNTQERRKSETSRSNAREKFAKLSAVPRALRDNDLLVIGKTALEKNREKLQKKAISTGMSRINSAKYQPTMRLHLTPEQLNKLGLKSSGKRISGQVKPEILASMIRSLMGGVDLVRKGNVSTASADELEARYLSPPQTKKRQKKRSARSTKSKSAPKKRSLPSRSR